MSFISWIEITELQKRRLSNFQETEAITSSQ